MPTDAPRPDPEKAREVAKRASEWIQLFDDDHRCADMDIEIGGETRCPACEAGELLARALPFVLAFADGLAALTPTPEQGEGG